MANIPAEDVTGEEKQADGNQIRNAQGERRCHQNERYNDRQRGKEDKPADTKSAEPIIASEVWSSRRRRQRTKASKEGFEFAGVKDCCELFRQFGCEYPFRRVGIISSAHRTERIQFMSARGEAIH